jgi:very-short-patch-repair endonuclease
VKVLAVAGEAAQTASVVAASKREERAVRPPDSAARHLDLAERAQRDGGANTAGTRHVIRGLEEMDRAASRLASTQLGNVKHCQLRQAGLSNATIYRWVRRERLHPRHRGVYAYGHTALPPFSAEMAAVMACGDDALLSHASAAWVWGLRPEPEHNRVDVAVPGRHVRSRKGIRVHRTEHLDPRDVRTHHGIPITSAARTILDIGPDLEERELERAFDEAVVRKLLTVWQMRHVLERYPRRPACGLIRHLIQSGRPTTATRSGGEEELHRLIRKAGLPEPEVNARIGRWTVDFLWRREGLVVEVDGHDYHSSRWALDRDHTKDADLRGRGLEVLRFTGRKAKREPLVALAAIAAALRPPRHA